MRNKSRVMLALCGALALVSLAGCKSTAQQIVENAMDRHASNIASNFSAALGKAGDSSSFDPNLEELVANPQPEYPEKLHTGYYFGELDDGRATYRAVVTMLSSDGSTFNRSKYAMYGCIEMAGVLGNSSSFTVEDIECTDWVQQSAAVGAHAFGRWHLVKISRYIDLPAS